MDNYNHVLTYIVNSSQKSFTVQDIKMLFSLSESTVTFIFNKFINLKILRPFWLKRGIYIKYQEFNYSDYLYLSQKIITDSVIWFETSLAFYWVLKKKPSSCYNSVFGRTIKRYRYWEFSYQYISLSEKLYRLWIVKVWNLIIYEPEKAYLDLLYINSLNWTKYDDYGVMYSQLNSDKLQAYSKYYPERVREQLEVNLKKDFWENNFEWTDWTLFDNLN